MLGLAEVTYTYATITCSHPGCNNRINLQPGPEDLDRELRDLRSLRRSRPNKDGHSRTTTR